MRVWGFASELRPAIFGRTCFEENAWSQCYAGSSRTCLCGPPRARAGHARWREASRRRHCGARRRPSTVGRIRGSTASTIDEGAREMENSRGRSAGRAGTSGQGSAERPDVAFGRSTLSEDVRDMLWVPPEAEDPSFGRMTRTRVEFRPRERPDGPARVPTGDRGLRRSNGGESPQGTRARVAEEDPRGGHDGEG